MQKMLSITTVARHTPLTMLESSFLSGGHSVKDTVTLQNEVTVVRLATQAQERILERREQHANVLEGLRKANAKRPEPTSGAPLVCQTRARFGRQAALVLCSLPWRLQRSARSRAAS